MGQKMCKLNEELLRVDGLEEKEKLVNEPVEAVDPTYNDAINSHKKIKANLEDVFKEQEKATNEFIKENEKNELKLKGTPEMKKLKLSESLFEDYSSDPGTYDKIFTILDNIEHLVNSTMEWSDEEWTIDNCKQTADMLEEEVKNFKSKIAEIEKNSIEEAVALEEPPIVADNEFYYSKRRQPLADIIMSELTLGEYPVYKKSASGKFNPTNGPCLNIDDYDIGINDDSKGDYILARVDSADKLRDIESVANKYDREFDSEFDRWARGKKYIGKIYVSEQDWEEPYFDPNVKIRTR